MANRKARAAARDGDGGISDAEHAKRQRENAKRNDAARENAIGNPHVDSVLTTEEHVGKIGPERHKTREMEARKTDQADRTGVQTVRTRGRKTAGKGTTDEVVTSPDTAVTTGATVGVQSEAEKAKAAIKGGRRKTSRR